MALYQALYMGASAGHDQVHRVQAICGNAIRRRYQALGTQHQPSKPPDYSSVFEFQVHSSFYISSIQTLAVVPKSVAVYPQACTPWIRVQNQRPQVKTVSSPGTSSLRFR